MVIPHRKLLILPTPRSVKRFVAHSPKLQASGVVIRHLRTGDAFIPEDILLKLVPHVSRTLTSLSISFGALQSRYVHDLIKSGHCKLKRIHIVGDKKVLRSSSTTSGDWWKKAYILHRIGSLIELKISNIYFYGEFREFQASVLSPIRTLHLEGVCFETDKAVEHFAWPLVYHLKDISLTNVEMISSNQPVIKELCRVLGARLSSLRIVDYPINPWRPGVCLRQLCSHLSILESLEIDSYYYFVPCRDRRNEQCYLELPQTLKHCQIGPLTWEKAPAFLEKKGDPDYLPHLQSVPIINLYPDERAQYQPQLNENNSDLIKVESGKRVFKSFELR